MFIKKFIEYDPVVNAGTFKLGTPFSCNTTFQLDANPNIILIFGKNADYYLTEIELLDFDYMLPLKLLKLIPNALLHCNEVSLLKRRKLFQNVSYDDTEVELEFVYDKITDKAILYFDEQSVETINCIVAENFPANGKIAFYLDKQNKLIKVEFMEPKFMLPQVISELLLH